MSAEAALVTYARDDDSRVAVITLNRPDKLNAFNDEMVRALRGAFRQLEDDGEANVGVLMGAGRAFSSGADVKERQAKPREELIKLGGPEARDARSERLYYDWVKWKPLVACVHGYVMGMAVGIALSCDFVVAAADSRFQVTEVPRGLSGARYWALLHFRGGASFADDVVLSGRWFTGEEACRAGIANRSVPSGSVQEAAMAHATAMAELPPTSVRETVRTRRWFLERAERDALLIRELSALHLSPEFEERIRDESAREAEM